MKKLKIQALQIESFVTTISKNESITIQGGNISPTTPGRPGCPPITGESACQCTAGPDCPTYQTGQSFRYDDCKSVVPLPYFCGPKQAVAVIAEA